MFNKFPHLLFSLFLLSSILTSESSYGQTCPVGMTHYWEFDDQTGTTFSDRNSTDAVCSSQAAINCPTFLDNLSQIGASCLFFNSTDSQGAEIPDNSSFDWGAGDSFSIEFWMASDETSFTDNVVIVGRDDRVTIDGAGIHWWIGVEGDPNNGTTNDGTIRFQLRDASNNAAAPYLGGKGPQVNDGNWHHIVAVRDGSNGENIIYVDGSEVDKKSYTYSSNFSSSAPITIGHLASAVSADRFFYDGPLDELAMYNRVLTPSEISDHANNRQTYCSIDLVGIEEIDITSTFKVFPNPVGNKDFRLVLENNVSGDFGVRIYDLTGKLLIVDSFKKNKKVLEHNLSVGSLSEGVYILEIRSKNFIGKQKFLKN